MWQRLLKAKEPHQVKFIWVKGHNGHEFNERCDEMAVASANSENLLDDKGFYKTLNNVCKYGMF